MEDSSRILAHPTFMTRFSRMLALLSPQTQRARSREIGAGVTFGRNSRVLGKTVSIGSGTHIGDDVVIMADDVKIGRRCKIESNVEASWHGGNAERFAMGDCCFIGRDSRILAREFNAGDYVVLHNHLLANGDGELHLGNNAWMGQNGILNANQPLKIGNNVGIGAYSAIWTHGKFGALIDGCLMHKEAPVTIDDDACLWRAVVSPGVTVGRKVTVLPGAILTRDAPAGSCFGGVPAEDLSSKVKTYRSVTIEEQYGMMREFVAEFLSKEYPGSYVMTSEDDYRVKSGEERFRLLLKWEIEDKDIAGEERAIVVGVNDSTTRRRQDVSVFNLTNREYSKWLTDPEVKFMWFMLDSRARFVPSEPK
jgi:UDP-3-O-[3-hydroxymyristoyl] glucosamine N-acyltransferase